ncbi:MAG: cyclase family protein [Candidatus Theseobacter exili]|nr:cyclase family protein [Candidatus Theseobacter exili]
MKKIVDLTGRLENGLWDYRKLPGLEELIPPVQIESLASVKKDGFSISKVTCCTISGTYLEAGAHMIEGAKTLDKYSVERFVQPVKILRLPKQNKNALIDDKILKENAPAIEKGDALIIDTGWGEQWNKPGYVLECPNFRRNALEWILEQGISTLGVDVPLIEAAWSEDDEETKGGLLVEFFKSDALLIAPLVNLDKVPTGTGTLVFLPLFLKDASGAPVRVIYVQE